MTFLIGKTGSGKTTLIKSFYGDISIKNSKKFEIVEFKMTGGEPLLVEKHYEIMSKLKKDTIIKKFKSSVTDSSNSITYDVKSKPGISNLIEIYSTINNLEIEETENKFNDYPYGEFKIAVAESTISYLEPINEKFNNLGDKEVDKIITNNLEIAKDSAVNTISEVKDALGIN